MTTPDTTIILHAINHDGLVDLLCTATYRSNWLSIEAPDREGLNIADTDCREDIWAKALLAGKSIQAIDYYAEDEVYSPNATLDEDGNGVYTLDMKSVLKGLQNAIDGKFKNAEDERDYVIDCVIDFLKGDGSMDLPEAETLMQIIMFNEVIYG